MTIEEYLKRRKNGQSLEEIQEARVLSDGTVWTLELGYQCYLKNIALNDAIVLIKNSDFS